MANATSTGCYTFQSEPNEQAAGNVTRRLQAFNQAHLASDNESTPLEVYALDGAGKLVGGLVGKTVWGWLEVGVIWVDEELRGHGLGSELMRRAEAEARSRGCVSARLSTFDFQAPSFYEQVGYVPYGKLEGYPAGHTVHYFRKDLT